MMAGDVSMPPWRDPGPGVTDSRGPKAQRRAHKQRNIRAGSLRSVASPDDLALLRDRLAGEQGGADAEPEMP